MKQSVREGEIINVKSQNDDEHFKSEGFKEKKRKQGAND